MTWATSPKLSRKTDQQTTRIGHLNSLMRFCVKLDGVEEDDHVEVVEPPPKPKPQIINVDDDDSVAESTTTTTTTTNKRAKTEERSSSKRQRPNQPKVNSLTLHFDGRAKGNPGRGGAGAAISGAHIQEEYIKVSRTLGSSATRNFAEYMGLIMGLRQTLEFLEDERIVNLGYHESAERMSLEIIGDSELVIRQMTGQYKVKTKDLRILHSIATVLAAKFKGINWRSVPRAENKLRISSPIKLRTILASTTKTKCFTSLPILDLFQRLTSATRGVIQPSMAICYE